MGVLESSGVRCIVGGGDDRMMLCCARGAETQLALDLYLYIARPSLIIL